MMKKKKKLTSCILKCNEIDNVQQSKSPGPFDFDRN